MRKRPLGRTDLVVSELTLGTWGLSGDGYGAVAVDEQERTVKRALEIGITAFDTCDGYGAGEMEKHLGEWTRGKSDVIIITRGGTDRKTEPAKKNFASGYLRGAVERSLKRLGRDRLDVYLLHNPTVETLGSGEAVGEMKKLVAEGKIGHWGVSVGDDETARLAMDQGAEVISLAYNLLQSIDLHRVSGDVMVNGTGVMVHSVLAYGMLSGVWSKDQEFPEGDHRRNRWTKRELETRLEHVEALRSLIHGQITSMRGAAVRYPLSNHVVSSVILGPRNVAQLEELIRETGGGPTYIPDRDLAGIPRTLSRLGIPS